MNRSQMGSIPTLLEFTGFPVFSLGNLWRRMPFQCPLVEPFTILFLPVVEVLI